MAHAVQNTPVRGASQQAQAAVIHIRGLIRQEKTDPCSKDMHVQAADNMTEGLVALEQTVVAHAVQEHLGAQDKPVKISSCHSH